MWHQHSSITRHASSQQPQRGWQWLPLESTFSLLVCTLPALLECTYELPLARHREQVTWPPRQRRDLVAHKYVLMRRH